MARPVRSGGTPPSATVIGGSIAGVLTATALSEAGFQVTVLERDRLPDGPRGRRGVPQDVQPHILLHRGMTVIESLLPGFRAALLDSGGVPFDSGRMPWLGEYGWLDTGVSTFEIVSATRPLMESVARRRMAALTPVRIRDGVTVRGLLREGSDWVVRTGSTDRRTSVVVDASGRSSRLGQWLPELTPPSEQVDARMGYASRLYRQRRPMPLRTGVMIFGTVELGMAGLALPVEDQGWLVAAAGFGDRRPPRDGPGFDRFLAELRDPALADLTAALDPITDVAVHRQTANLRRRWDRVAGWPDGLLVVGDALCALDPVYGQGITVAAQQAEIVARAARPGTPPNRALQRRLVAATDAPWSIATTNDLRMPSCPEEPSMTQRWSARWGGSVGRLAASGNVRATRTISGINHLMTPPVALFNPALVTSVVRGIPPHRLPRPAVLEELSQTRREHPPPAPASA